MFQIQSDAYRSIFDEEELIYIPRADTKPLWVSPSDCVWMAPAVLREPHALEPIYESKQDLFQLFTRVLEVRDAGLEDILDELSDIKEDGTAKNESCSFTGTRLIVVQLYQYLDGLKLEDADLNLLQYVFKDVISLN